MQVRVLGPVEVVDDFGDRVDLGPKEALTLARLAAARRRAVADSVLIDALWRTPPATARKTLHGYVHRLRRALGGETIVRDSAGYRLADVELDIDTVDRTVDTARIAVTDRRFADAAIAFRSARAQFRGRPLPELDDDRDAVALRRELEELGNCILEELFDAEISAGNAATVIGELEHVVTAEPSRERCWSLLVMALARAGRQADALGALSRARRALALEIGAEPGPQLRALEHEVLHQRIAPARPPVAEDDARGSRSRLPDALLVRADDIVMVGRTSPLERLRDTWQRTKRTGRGSAEIVVGEPGVGKTRLAAEIARFAHADGGTVVFGRCSDGAGGPYQPLAEALEQALAQVSPDLAPALGTTGADRLILGTDAAGLKTTPEADRYQLFEEVTAAFASAAGGRPMLFAVDDLHWGTEATVLAIRHLVRRASFPMMLVVTVREPEFGGTQVIATLGGEPEVGVTHLGGLDLAEAREFVARASCTASDADLDIDELFRRTGGNPFLLRELVRADAPPGAAVPAAVRDAIAARARRLPEAAADLLHIASLIGLEFDLELLATAADVGFDAAVEALDAAIAAQLIAERSERPITYAFRHALVRDAVVAGLSNGRRSVLHGRIARALERNEQPSVAETSRLAHHYLGAPGERARAKACHYAEQAGRGSLAGFAYDDARMWFTAALDAAAGLPSDDERACRLHLSLALCATLAGDEQGARLAAQDAWRLARATGDRDSEMAAALLYAGEPELNVVGDEPGRIMLAATRDLPGGRDGDRARVIARLGSALSYTEHERATELLVEAEALARSSGGPADLAYVIRCRLRGWFHPGHVEERMALADELERIGSELHDPVNRSWGVRWQIVTNFETGDVPAIERGCAELAMLGQRLQLPNQRWSAAARLAAVRTMQGRFDEADHLTARAREFEGTINNQLTHEIIELLTLTLGWLTGRAPAPAPGIAVGAMSPVPILRGLWLDAAAPMVLDRIAADPTRFLTADILWLEQATSVALTMRSHPHTGAAVAVYPLAARVADAISVFSPAAGIYGSMHLYAGLLARVAGHHRRAIDHLRRAVAVNTGLGALPFVALASHELAATLGGGHEALAADHHARTIARDLGIPWLT